MVNLLHYEDLTGVVLVGLSYGGMVVAEAAGRVPERNAHLVYFGSNVLRDGDTSGLPSQHAARAALAREHGEGWHVPPEVTRVEAVLLDGLPEERHQWIAPRYPA